MVLKSPVHDALAACGASFFRHDDWEIAEHFGDPKREHGAVRGSVGVLDLCWLGRLRISGRDCTFFLHNMLSNDVRNLVPGNGCHAAMLSRQGHVEADVHVYRRSSDFVLECMPACAARLSETLSRFIVAQDVIIEDAAERFGVLSLQGPGAREVAERTVGAPLPVEAPLSHRMLERLSGPWTVISRDRTGRGGFDIWLPIPDIEGVWRRWTEIERVQPVGFEALNVLRTEAGIPWYGLDIDDRTLPMEAGLSDAVSLTKGCYRGQEIMARITHRSRLDRGFGGIVVDGPAAPRTGSEVFAADRRIGKITSAIFSMVLGRPLALGILHKEFLSEGAEVAVQYDKARLPARVVRLPLGALDQGEDR